MYSSYLKFKSRWILTSATLTVLAVGCSDEPSDLAVDESGSETLSQVVLDGGVRVDGSAPTSADASVQVDGGAAATFCDVLTVMKTAKCGSCHGAETAAGAPMSLVTYADFQADAVLTPGKKVYEVTQTRMKDTRRPMPPRGVRPAAELQVIDSWIAGGAKPPSTPCP
jgi:cytochrome c553